MLEYTSPVCQSKNRLSRQAKKAMYLNGESSQTESETLS